MQKSMTLLPTPQPTLSSVLKLSTSVWSFSGVRASRQGPSLHSSKAAAAPWQESPPLRASLETFRWRSLIPSPQDLEQGLHPSHSVHWQSTKWKKILWYTIGFDLCLPSANSSHLFRRVWTSSCLGQSLRSYVSCVSPKCCWKPFQSIFWNKIWW